MPEQRKRMTYEQQRAQKQPGSRPGRSVSAKPADAKVSRRVSDSPAVPIAFTKHTMAKVVAVVVLIAIVAFALRICSSAMTIGITVNGSPCTLHGAKTIETAIKESGLPINPGDLISLRGTVLKKSEGHPFAATVNGEETVDPAFQLHEGDQLVITDGEDIVEDYDSTQEATPRTVQIAGVGAIHEFTPGEDGVLEIRTGRISGDVVERELSEPSESLYVKYNPEVGGDKILALTFDQGPSEEYTGQILDILAENDARATFFCSGAEIENGDGSLVRRERDGGHQVCAGTYDHANSTENASAASLDADTLVDQVERGRAAISEAAGEDEVSRIVRLPVMELGENMVRALEGHVQADIGWNVDTGDWSDASADSIYSVLMSLEAGDIVLCHDGGDDRSATVEALRRAVPKLKSKGFSFVTIDELMPYPAQ